MVVKMRALVIYSIHLQGGANGAISDRTSHAQFASTKPEEKPPPYERGMEIAKEVTWLDQKE